VVRRVTASTVNRAQRFERGAGRPDVVDELDGRPVAIGVSKVVAPAITGSASMLAFLLAIVLFTLGGLYAFYEGYHKVVDPHPLESPLVAVAVFADRRRPGGVCAADCGGRRTGPVAGVTGCGSSPLPVDFLASEFRAMHQRPLRTVARLS
jgi:hypothetical protein